MAAEQPPGTGRSLFVTGLSHKTAPLTLRERLAMPADGVTSLLKKLTADGHFSEALLLMTCNRFELYGVARGPTVDMVSLGGSLLPALGIDPASESDYLYLHEGEDVGKHLLRVAASLDSLVVGEVQILGQVKESYQ